MRKLLSDIIKHTHGLGFVDAVKVVCDDKETTFKAMDVDKAVLITAQAHEYEPNLEGTFGMGRLQILNGYLNFANYKADDASVSVTRADHGSTKNVPEQLVFDDGNGQRSVYRFMSADLISTASIGRTLSWDVSVELTQSKVNELRELAGILSGTNPFFHVRTEGGRLIFSVGDKASDNLEVTMAHDVEGEIKGELSWTIDKLLPILRLGAPTNPTLGISNSFSALGVTFDSESASYSYILQAQRY